MRILLVYPKPNILFDTARCLPLGMGYVAAVLEKEGHKVSVLDLNVQDDYLEKKIGEEEIELVGIYAKTVHIKSAWNLCKRVKEFKTTITTVLGGPHPSVLPEESLEKKFVDIVVRKEGEYTVKDLCEVLEGGSGISEVKGISFRKNGKIFHNPDRDLIENLDALPLPAYHLFPFDSYTVTRPTWLNRKKLKPATIVTSRGCPFECIFCFKGIHGREYRYRSAESVVEEMKFLVKRYKVNFIEIVDDAFSLIPARVVKICELLLRENLDLKWSVPEGFARVDEVTTELLSVAKRAGCVDFWFALESGSQRVLDKIINKGTTIEQVRRAVRTAKKVGLEVGAFVCIGNPGETEQEIRQSIDLACTLNLDKCQFTIVTPYPGSKLFEILNDNDKLLVKDWDCYSPYEKKAFFEYDRMKKERIELLYNLAFRKFYLRPSYILKTLLRSATYANSPLIMKEIRQFIVG